MYRLQRMYIPLCLLFLCSTMTISNAQQSWKFGVGLGLNQSRFTESLSSQELLQPNLNVAKIGFSTMIRAEKSVTSQLKVAFTPSINFIGASSDFSPITTDYSAVTFTLPAQLHYFPINNLFVGTGPAYSYLTNLSLSVEDMSNDATEFAERHLLELRHSIGYIVKDWVEVSLSYNHSMNALLNAAVTDVNGNPVGDYSIKYNYFQLGIVVRR